MAAKKARNKGASAKRKNALYSVDIEPVSKDEQISAQLFKHVKFSKPSDERHSRVEGWTGIAANIIIPGLGNYYLHKSKAGMALIAINLLFIIVFISPIYTLNFAVNSVGQSIEGSASPVATIFSYGPSIELQHPFSAYFFIPLFFIAVSWIYLIFQLIHGKRK